LLGHGRSMTRAGTGAAEPAGTPESN
jgi:hypothetical protein